LDKYQFTRFTIFVKIFMLMNRLISFLGRNLREIIIVSLFTLTTLIILLLFPGEGRFRFEFQKGAPWMHDELIAPFDFPIYKYDDEIAAARDSILREFKPYFLMDPEVAAQQLTRLDAAFELSWQEYTTAGRNTGGQNRTRFTDEMRSNYHRMAADIIRFVYSKGIISNEDVLDRVNNEDATIVIVRNQVAEERDYKEVFTQKKAYEYVIGQLQTYADSLHNESDIEFFRSLNINEFLIPNLYYDAATSGRVKEELISQISLTKGMVQSGQRIISRGELVTAEKYRVLDSLRKEYEKNLGLQGHFNYIFLGKIILVTILMILLYLFLYNFKRKILRSTRETSFILLLILILVAVSSFTIRYDVLSLYFLPFALVPIMIRTFFDSRLAFFIHVVVVLIVGFWAPNSFEFIFLNLIAGLVAIFSLTNSYRRGILFLTAVLIIASYSLVYFAFSIIQEGNLSSIHFKTFLWFAGNGLLILTSYPLIFIFEKSFKFLSDSTLIELSDTNQPLLRELAEKAPGTFQHSLQVANLAEEAIYRIGGNVLLIRTGALYHDIGKMINPGYFIENQVTDTNPHDKLEFEESARIIIDHVSRGVEIGRRHRLPEAIIDFITTHHGTTLVQYFYKSSLKKYPADESHMAKFKYGGPKPFSRETAVLMMADSVEASSRSLKVRNEETLKNLVEQIINYQIEEAQFDNSEITFRDIHRIKQIFLKKLLNIYHVRIEYPQ
jgi:putative nucleotidyltransferase with HDIG domain